MQQMLKEQKERFKAEIAKIQAGQQSNVGGSNITPSQPEVQREEVQPQKIHVNPIVAVGTSSRLKKNRPCKLAVGSRDNIVALRYVQESTLSTIIHSKELGENNFRVSVEVVLDSIALIPIPNPDDDTRLVGDVLGSHLA
ncbi:hypothetical protein PanWU01x14_350680 [Parasponia andersonii]|uniref:DUF8039 domain-containing protein n=1 Tax=Parasponia andersonii TaxID=3476 RepID=A0A2P5AAV8_PARAD|nr:hypothetical protein PanWU01x14_350680 [Parasponia andersonii]